MHWNHNQARFSMLIQAPMIPSIYLPEVVFEWVQLTWLSGNSSHLRFQREGWGEWRRGGRMMGATITSLEWPTFFRRPTYFLGFFPRIFSSSLPPLTANMSASAIFILDLKGKVSLCRLVVDGREVDITVFTTKHLLIGNDNVPRYKSLEMARNWRSYAFNS